jgi:microcystin-dependent protein
MNPFVGEIRIFSFNFAPKGWATCDGQLLPITQNTALFSILGTFYGGDGQSTFALPNLQGSAAIQQGQGPGLSLYDLGETGGNQAVTLLTGQIPRHNHLPSCLNGAGTATTPANNVWAAAMTGRQGESRYSATPGTTQAMNPQALAPTGGDTSHNNMPPYLVLNFCVCMQGVFPPRS